MDHLFSPDRNSRRDFGIHLESSADGSDPATSISLIGRSGTGKSLLGLHLASRYLADCLEKANQPSEIPKVYYVSTDFTFARAQSAWTNFGLDYPNLRVLPFGDQQAYKQDDDKVRQLHIALNPCLFAAIQQTLAAEKQDPSAHFIDLASSTAGDDWGLILRLLSLLPETALKHLLVIDAVEGLETLTGSLDPHGHEHSHRARIAQLLRAAGEKCHIGLILEESHVGDIPPEEYVTDVVLRLWANEVDGYMRRSLEVAKSRGGSHVRGHHNYFIRDGQGLREPSPDDPVNERPPFTVSGQEKKARKLAYVSVVESLHWLTRMRMQRKKEIVEPARAKQPDPNYATFYSPKLARILPNNGLPRGRVTALTGDEATYKARFGRAFLNGCFSHPEDKKPDKKPDLPKEVGVYITTHNLSRSKLVEKLSWHWHPITSQTRQRLEGEQPSQIVFRQLEAHNLNSPVLFHVIRRCVEEGIQQAENFENSRSGKQDEPARVHESAWWVQTPNSYLVRLVIDDWTTIKNSYPQVAHDPLFLPFLIRYLEEKGVTTLIVETSPGRPDQIFNAETDRNLRSLVQNHLLTWHVRFYGEDRVAFAAIPPLRDSLPAVVAELRTPPPYALLREGENNADERLWADPHFELYMGLERGDPTPVPLEVHLFASAERFSAYREQTNAVFNRLFTPYDKAGGVVKGYAPSDYAALREYTQLLGDVRSPRTEVMQVDEYWKAGPKSILRTLAGEDELLGTEPYICQSTTNAVGLPHDLNDPYLEFQHEDTIRAKSLGDIPLHLQDRFFRFQFFDSTQLAYFDPSIRRIEDLQKAWHDHFGRQNLTPYLWDFGFLLLRKRAWQGEIAKHQEHSALVRRVWNYCTKPAKDGEGIKWDEFLSACKSVASAQTPSQGVPMLAFDMDMLSPQTFPCLVLEMWASEIRDSLDETTLQHETHKSKPPFCHIRHGEEGAHLSLNELLETYSSEFVRVWLLVGEVIAPSQLLAENGYLATRPAPNSAAAERHWYSTATHVWGKLKDGDMVVPARLPGRYSTRGDWFLTIGSDSRSVRLGERAIDLLSRRKENVHRMEFGIGLPVRDTVWEAVSETDQGQTKQPRKPILHPSLRTALRTEDKTNVKREMYYDGLYALGGSSRGQLQWLWRSQITDFHRHDRIFERWTARFLKMAGEWNQRLKFNGLSGFEAYKLFKDKKGAPNKLIADFKSDFLARANELREVLCRFTPPPVSRHIASS